MLCREGFRFLGMTNYMTFPQAATGDVWDYNSLCEAWCHCFRQPDGYLPSDRPRALISHSDFTDYVWLSPAHVTPQCEPDFVHDFIYVGTRESWKQPAKNWALAARCISRICEELSLRALLIDVPSEGLEPSTHIHVIQPLPWPAFVARLAHARFLFAPNFLDPSPKVLTETLCLDRPLVVNRQILGGWKYINAFTGAFFDDENNVVAAVRNCLTRFKSPRRWFCANYGPYLAGNRLLCLLRRLDPRITEDSYVGLMPMDDARGDASVVLGQ
jgi:hypothetical protein